MRDSPIYNFGESALTEGSEDNRCKHVYENWQSPLSSSCQVFNGCYGEPHGCCENLDPAEGELGITGGNKYQSFFVFLYVASFLIL